MTGGAETGALATVRKFYELMGQDRFEEANAFLGADVVIRESPDLPFGGDYHGLAGNAELIGHMTRVFDLAITEADFHDCGPFVVAKLKARFTKRATGEAVALDIVEMLKVADGQIVDIDIYHKSPGVVAGLWLS